MDEKYNPLKMNASENLKQAIKGFEGFKGEPYQDIAGHWTGGWGHKLIDNNPQWIAVSLAEQWLDQDIRIAQEPVMNKVTALLTQGQFDALTDFCFNVGGGTFTKSKIWRHINSGDIPAAAAELSLYDLAGGKTSLGLQRRRAWEKSQLIAP